MKDLKEEIILNLRAIIISNKGDVDLNQINDDYKDIFGVDIPLKTLGCKSVREFFQNNSDNFTLVGTKVQAVTKISSHHIVSMIQKQRNTGEKKETIHKGNTKIITQPFQTKRKFLDDDDSTFAAEPKKKKRRKIPRKTNHYLGHTKRNLRYDNLKSNSNFVNTVQYSTYEDYLNYLCFLRGWVKPTYNITYRRTQNGAKRYNCELKIDTRFRVSTYPSETRCEIEAKELASKKAVLALTLGNYDLFCQVEGYVTSLRNVCWQMNLPEPVFNSFECHTGNRQNFFISEVFIGNNIFNSSYPTKSIDVQSARDLAAKKTLEYLNFRSNLLYCAGRSIPNLSDVMTDHQFRY